MEGGEGRAAAAAGTALFGPSCVLDGRPSRPANRTPPAALDSASSSSNAH
jgi:hypothetical protein